MDQTGPSQGPAAFVRTSCRSQSVLNLSGDGTVSLCSSMSNSEPSGSVGAAALPAPATSALCEYCSSR